jgi:hypothetical protein
MRFTDLTLTAQTAYAELAEQAHVIELQAALTGFPGAFHKRTIKGREYWYFGYRDLNGKGRMAYVGPDNDRVRALVEQFKNWRGRKPLLPLTGAAISLGCEVIASKHFRIIKRLADYGFFRAGGLLIGTHAFIAMGNLLGVRWGDGQRTQDVDFAHAGKNVSVALPANLKLSVHDALTSLEMGLLPIRQFEGGAGAQYRNPADPELRLDFVTSTHRKVGEPVVLAELGLALEPLKFMEFSLQGSTQGCVLAREGACMVNLPDPARYAVHKLIVYGERPVRERTKAGKDLLQAACLASFFVTRGPIESFNEAWRDALSRGRGWKARAVQGQSALLELAPELDDSRLWHAD